MESEALRNIRTLRQVKSSLEVAAKQRIKTTNSLYKTAEEIDHLESLGLDSLQTAQVLDKEKARAANLEASRERSRQKLLKSRDKIACLVNRNLALTRLRHQIQQDRDRKEAPPAFTKAIVKQENSDYSRLRGVELKY